MSIIPDINNNKIPNAKFMVRRTYPSINNSIIAKREVNINIISKKELPEEFFKELQFLIHKHT